MNQDSDKREDSGRDYRIEFSVDKSPDLVFKAISNVRGWWSGEITGVTDQLNAIFTYTMPGLHKTTQKITEYVEGQRIVWHVTESYLSFVKDTKEWDNTEIMFDISKAAGHTVVVFTHKGLSPQFECYDSCSNAWGVLVNRNLRNLIISGKDQPSPWS